MCGIFAVINVDGRKYKTGMKALKASGYQKYRGPDFTGIKSLTRGVFVQERLAVMAPMSNDANQPLFSKCGKISLIANAEIYNYKEIIDHCVQFGINPPNGPGDCEAIILAYIRWGENFVHFLDGIFSFILMDERGNKPKFIAGRDHIGINPMYMGVYKNNLVNKNNGEDEILLFSSEMKCIIKYEFDDNNDKNALCIRQFPPGHIISGTISENKIKNRNKIRWYNPKWMAIHPYDYPCNDTTPERLRNMLTNAVYKQIQCDAPFGALLSGGLDSSLIASIAARLLPDPSILQTFSIGLEDSPDLINSRLVSQHIGSTHHEFVFTIEEGLMAIPYVIKHIESYDVTTVRASIPMFIMANRISNMNIKMVLSGEGADEIFGGYLYFHKAPNEHEFFKELSRKVQKLHMYDCLRCNKSMAAWGVEARVPFLDKLLVDEIMMVNPRKKMCIDECNNSRIEKYILRKAFDVHSPEMPYLPSDILWRQKEQFSDGVGYSWIQSLKNKMNTDISNAKMDKASARFPHNTPTTKEAYGYRAIFENIFKHEDCVKTVPGGASIACSTPEVMSWDSNFSKNEDQSGLAVKDVHIAERKYLK